MYNKIVLYFWVFHNKLISPVEIEKTHTIMHLRVAIKDKKLHPLQGYDADKMPLWKLCVVKGADGCIYTSSTPK